MDDIPKPPEPFAAVDREEALTISDLGPLAHDLFFVPGDWLLWSLAEHAAPVAGFLEVGPESYGGVLSGFLSALAWIFLILVVSIAYRGIRDFDEALTRRIVDGYGEIKRRSRIGCTLIAYRVRRLREPRAEAKTIQVSEELEVSTAELRVLHVHAGVKPGYALGLSEIARAVGLRGYEVQRCVERLQRLNLLTSTVGGLDGENAYKLTQAGRAFLLFRQIAPREMRRPAPAK